MSLIFPSQVVDHISSFPEIFRYFPKNFTEISVLLLYRFYHNPHTHIPIIQIPVAHVPKTQIIYSTNQNQIRREYPPLETYKNIHGPDFSIHGPDFPIHGPAEHNVITHGPTEGPTGAIQYSPRTTSFFISLFF